MAKVFQLNFGKNRQACGHRVGRRLDTPAWSRYSRLSSRTGNGSYRDNGHSTIGGHSTSGQCLDRLDNNRDNRMPLIGTWRIFAKVQLNT